MVVLKIRVAQASAVARRGAIVRASGCQGLPKGRPEALQFSGSELLTKSAFGCARSQQDVCGLGWTSSNQASLEANAHQTPRSRLPATDSAARDLHAGGFYSNDLACSMSAVMHEQGQKQKNAVACRNAADNRAGHRKHHDVCDDGDCRPDDHDILEDIIGYGAIGRECEDRAGLKPGFDRRRRSRNKSGVGHANWTPRWLSQWTRTGRIAAPCRARDGAQAQGRISAGSDQGRRSARGVEGAGRRDRCR